MQLLLVVVVAGPVARPPTDLSVGQGGEGPLPDDVPFELSQGAEDVEDRLPAAGRRVDGLLQAPEPHGAIAQVGDVSMKCLRLRPSRSSFQTTSESPDRTSARARSLLQAGPLGLGPARLVGVELLAAYSLQSQLPGGRGSARGSRPWRTRSSIIPPPVGPAPLPTRQSHKSPAIGPEVRL